MAQIDYDIYINSQTNKNPIYDERWNADSVYGDNVESRSNGVVNVWNVVSSKLGATSSAYTFAILRNEVLSAFVRANISIESTTDDISNALAVLPNTIDVKHYSFPFTQKGIYESLDDIFSVNEINIVSNPAFLQMFKFDTTITLEDISEVSDPTKVWGDGDGFKLGFYLEAPTEIGNSKLRSDFIPNHRKDWVTSVCSDWHNVKFLLIPHAVNYRVPATGKVEQGLQWYVAVDKPISTVMTVTVNTETQTGETISKNSNIHLFDVSQQPDGRYTDADGVQHGLYRTSLVLPRDIAGSGIFTPIGYTAYTPPYTEGIIPNEFTTDTVGSVISIVSDDAVDLNQNLLATTLDNLAKNYNPDDYTPVGNESVYNGDVCAWGADPFISITPYKRTYSTYKLTSSTSDTITLHFMDDGDEPPSDSDDYYSTPDPGDDTPDDEVPINTGSGYLTTTYSIGDANLRLLGQWVWSDGYQPLLKNSSPLENIINLIAFPLSLEGGTSDTVTIGASDSGIQAQRHSTIIQQYKSSALRIEREYGNFFDFEPYTHFTLYVPFIGFKDISPSLCTGKDLTLVYNVDISNGDICCELRADNQTVDLWNGNIGIRLPLTASNDAEKAAAFVGGVASIATSALSGNFVGIANSALDLASISSHYSTTGSLGGATAYANPLKPFIIIDRPNFMIPAGYAWQHGFRCDKTLRLSQCSGYTVVGDVSLDGLTCTDEEAKEIERLLKEGVYL